MIVTGRAGGRPTLAKTIDLVTRSKAVPPRAIDQKSNQRPSPHARHPSFAALQLPCTRDAMPRVGDRLQPRLGDRLAALHALAERPLFHAASASLTSSSVPCSFSIRPRVNSWS